MSCNGHAYNLYPPLSLSKIEYPVNGGGLTSSKSYLESSKSYIGLN